MSIAEYCQREVVTIGPQQTVTVAARCMLDQHVGCLVVISETKPVGIITDRDILRAVVATKKNPETMAVDQVMSTDLLMVTEDTGVFKTIGIMFDKGVRRLPVVDRKGNLVGIIALDDLLVLLGTELATLANISATERNKEVDRAKVAIARTG